MSTFNTFTPSVANTTLAVTNSTGNVSIAGTGSALFVGNVSTVEAFVAVGNSAVTVAAGGTKSATSDGGFSIPPNTYRIITLPPDATHIAGITAASATTLRISRGEGGS